MTTHYPFRRWVAPTPETAATVGRPFWAWVEPAAPPAGGRPWTYYAQMMGG